VLSGILHGVDPQIWEPRHDGALPLAYGIDEAMAGKRAAKAALQSRLGLERRDDAPLFGVISRLTWQKGIDLILAGLSGLVGVGGQLALLGAGEAELERGCAAAAQSYAGHVGVELGYDEQLSHLIIAGADVVLVPSRYEPCGLTQLYALRYGALPLVRRVGGLADTVVDATAVSLADGSATGFAFDEESVPALEAVMARAADLYRQQVLWRQMMRQAMTRDFSWDAAARQYLMLYQKMQVDLAAPR
jgi:starch synthase